MTIQAVWHNDGHSIQLGLDKGEVQILQTSCPQLGDCNHEDAPCVVEWFLDNYGLEINQGSCSIDGEIQIAWTFIEEGRDIESGQVWVIPANDPVFASWSDSQTSAYGDG